MNLIEQLGGYDRAKKLVDDCKRYGRSDVKVPVNGGFIHIFADFLELDLLEYRRQHNIFEVGDLITHPVFWGLFQVKEIMKHHVLGVTSTGYESKLAMELIRHATDAEIAAGRRL